MVDDRDPAQLIEDAVAHALRFADTWPRPDGTPAPAQDRVYTLHKAVRRLCDHLLNHLGELEARLAGRPPLTDYWHGSMGTTPADLAPFRQEDLGEARSRLQRLALLWTLRLHQVDDERLDRQEGDAWTLRQVAFHLDNTYYADPVGTLAPATDSASGPGTSSRYRAGPALTS